MRKLYFSLVLMAIGAMCNFAQAQRIDRSHAKEKARTFMNGRSEKMMNTSSSSRRKASAKLSTLTDVTMPNDYLYGFNVGNNEGFVIVAADDSASVIGYADEGYIDPNNMPDGLKDLLQRMGANVKKAVQGGNTVSLGTSSTGTSGANKAARKAATAYTTGKAIGPLLTTSWSQFEPYYNLTPTSSGSQTLTCCVATALAQIIYYLYATQDGQTSTTFTNAISGTIKVGSTEQSVSVSAPRTYNWSNMLPHYLGTYTTEQATEVATLMRDCGYALGVTYGTDESTAYTSSIPNIAKTYFGIDGASDSGTITDVSTFFSKVDAELNNYRPVQVCGNGHSFVCDGRAEDGIYYHFNFGYGGGNGFYCAGAYMSYDQKSDMECVTGFRLSTSSSTVTTTTGLTVAYNSAVKTLGLRPVGTIPGMYQVSYYNTLKGYLDTAKGVLDGTSTVSDVATLISNISTAEQNLIKYTTPFDSNGYNTTGHSTTDANANGTAYRIQTYKQIAGNYGQIGWYFDNDDGYYYGDAPYLSVYGISNSYNGSKFRFIYDEDSNGYYIGNNSLDFYMMGFDDPGYGKDLNFCVYGYDGTSTYHNTDPTTENDDGDTPIPCEVTPVDYLGDGTFAVTLRPLDSNYADNTQYFLDCWEENSSESFLPGTYSSSTDSYKVNGGDSYGEYYGRWTLVPVYGTDTSGSAVTATTPTATFSNSTVEIDNGSSATQTVTTNSTGTVTYSSSDISIASVDPTTGEVTGVGVGTATITAAIGGTTTYTTSGYAPAVATYTVTITTSGPKDPTSSFDRESVTLGIGNTFTNTLNTNSNGEVTYSSNNTSTATVNAKTGEVTAKGSGTATITATIAATSKYNAATITYTVKVIGNQTVSFANASETIMAGNSVTNAASTTGDGAITYSSSNESVATVDATTGEVTGVSLGTATITATAAETSKYAKATATYTVTVEKNTEYETAMAELLDIRQYLYTDDELAEAQNAGKTVLSKGLITASTQFSSPYTETKEGSFANLLDNDQSTFWHSKWSSGSVSAGTHYFIVALNEAETGDIYLSMGRRSNANDDHPTQFEVYGSNDNSTWTDITTLDLPFASNTETVTTTFSLGASYTYLKFVCTNTGSTSSSFTTRGYFHMGEFQLYRSTTYPASERATKLVTLSEVYSTANSAYTAGSVTKTTVDDLRAAINSYKTLGDVNLDGDVDIEDVTWLIHYLKGNTNIKRGITDINGDYKTNVNDVNNDDKTGLDDVILTK